MSVEATRHPGDPIPGALIREIRQREGLTQEQFARRVGVRGGKGVISGWERSGCDGPAAELILLLFGGTPEQARMSDLVEATNVAWGNGYPTWYDVTAALTGGRELSARTFAELFPSAALANDERRFGFPFVPGAGLPNEVLGLGANGWVGRIPAERDRPAAYYWRFTRQCTFVLREKAWEVDSLSSTGGHLHVGSLLEQAAGLIFFARKLSAKLGLSASDRWLFGVHVGGIRGRGVVATRDHDSSGAILSIGGPERVATDDRAGGSRSVSVEDLDNTPLTTVYDIVGEAVLDLAPSLAKQRVLEKQLLLRHVMDQRMRGHDRHLAFLDAFLNPSHE